MNVTINEEAMRVLVQKAIFDSMDPSTRDELVSRAIADLIAPQADSWARGRSKLQDIFQQATAEIARDVVRAQLATDASFKAQLADIVARALEKALATDQIVDSVTASILNGLTPRDR